MGQMTLNRLKSGVQANASAFLIDMLGPEKGKAASAHVAMAFSAAVRSARDPSAFLEIAETERGRSSIIAAIAASALSGIMPGGSNPKVWLIPKGGQVHWWLSHRGISTLALRAGFQIIAVAVHKHDELRVEFGEVVAHNADADAWPDSLDDMAGVYLTIRRLSDGVCLGRPWMNTRAIQKRAKMGGAVWNKWPVEQAQKTCVKWAMARGYIPIDDANLDAAMSLESSEQDRTPTTQATGASALGLGGPTVTPENPQIEATRELFPGNGQFTSPNDADTIMDEMPERQREPVMDMPEEPDIDDECPIF